MPAPRAEAIAGRAAITAELWRRAAEARDPVGLDYLLHSDQRTIRRKFLDATSRTWVLCCGRRWGKSRMACVLAVEVALSMPGADVKYAAQTKSEAEEIVVPHMRDVLEDCPPEMQPAFNATKKKWKFPNGSTIRLAGCDTERDADRLRGTSMHFGIVDEAGFIGPLKYLITSVLLPQTVTTGGRIIMLSSPAKTPAHPFTKYMLSAKASGNYAHRTIYDAPHVTQEIIDEMIEECGGEDTSDWKREYLAEVTMDTESAVVPEFAQEAKVIVSDDMPHPSHFDAYVSADLGFHDLTAVLFAFFDFERALVCIEDEVIAQHTSSGPIIADVQAKERALWGEQEPLIRVADCDEVLRSDMSREHNMAFARPRKDDKHAAVNAVRTAIRQHRIRIHPRCTTLIAHLGGATWNKARTKFGRAAGFGHFDAVDALVYLIRHVDMTRNPFPRLRNGESHATHWIPPEAPSETESALYAAFRPRRGRR